MGSEGGPTELSVQDTFEASTLVKLVRDGQEKSTIDRLIQQYGHSVMNPRSDGTSLLNSFALLGSFDAVSYLLEKGAIMSILEADGSTILHSVIRTTEQSNDFNRSKLLSLILESGNEVPVNHCNNKGWTALKLAAKKGLEQCVEVLLNHGAEPNISDNEGYLPLHNAVGNTDIVKLLIESTANINKQTHGGETPLYLSINHNNINSSLILLEHGADPNLPNKDGITPLFLASRSGSTSLVRELLRRKANPNAAGASQGIAPLHWAAHKENTEIALLLIEYGADVQQKDKEGRSPLSLASRDLATKMIELVAKLRNHPIKLPTPTQMTPLSKAMAACSGGNVPALKALLQSGGIRVNQICDPKNDATLLHTAVYCGQVGVVAMLLNSGADWKLKDKDGDTILHFSCMSANPVGNYVATLKFLLSSPAKSLINTQNSRGDTPLHVAIKCKYVDRAKLLIQNKAEVMITNNKNEYPLHKACCSDQNIEVVLDLSELISDINTQDGDGWTALMYAAKSNCPAVLKFLLQKKADTNLQQSSGYTALHLAAQENLPEICSIVLNRGADPNILGGDQGVSPLHIAAHKGFKEVCRVLAESGADYELKDNDKDTPLSLTDDEEIKTIILNSYVERCRVRSNSDPSPSNSPVGKRFVAMLTKSCSKEESEISDLKEMEVKLKEKEMIFEKMMQNFKKLKDDNIMYQSRVWELEGDLRQCEMASTLVDLQDDDEKAFSQRWWMVDSSHVSKTDKTLNDRSDDSMRFWNVDLGAFRMMDVAVKEIYRGETSSDVRKCFFREVEQLSRLHCPQIVQFFGAFYDKANPNRFGIIVEYQPNGNLSDLIHTHKVKLQRLQQMKIVRDIVLGMCYLHSYPVLHRALRPQNILLGEHLNAKISDFGFHETKILNGYVAYMRGRCKEITRSQFPVYTAPEVFERNEFTKASDVYSFSMLIYEITTGCQPFSDTDPSITLCKLLMKIMMGARPAIPKHLPVECQENFAKCWDKSPSVRPSFPKLLENVIVQIQRHKEELAEKGE